MKCLHPSLELVLSKCLTYIYANVARLIFLLVFVFVFFAKPLFWRLYIVQRRWGNACHWWATNNRNFQQFPKSTTIQHKNCKNVKASCQKSAHACDSQHFAFLNRSFQAKPELTEDQKQELREAFELFDADKTGSIDLHELKVLMRALGFDVKKPEVIKMVHGELIKSQHFIFFSKFETDVDPSNIGSVDYDQFLEISEFFDCIFVCDCDLQTQWLKDMLVVTQKKKSRKHSFSLTTTTLGKSPLKT